MKEDIFSKIQKGDELTEEEKSELITIQSQRLEELKEKDPAGYLEILNFYQELLLKVNENRTQS